GKCGGDYGNSELLVDEHAWLASEYYRDERDPAERGDQYAFPCAISGHRHDRQRDSGKGSNRHLNATQQRGQWKLRGRSEHGHHQCIRRGQPTHSPTVCHSTTLFRSGKCGGDYGNSELLVDEHAWLASEYYRDERDPAERGDQYAF